VALGDDLRMFLPVGRTYDPETGQGWEAEGIAPDIEVAYTKARERAVEEAAR
jgi:C-terminal processing protease CtpA/Prc